MHQMSQLASASWQPVRCRQLAARSLLIVLLLAVTSDLIGRHGAVHAFDSDELIDDNEFVSDNGGKGGEGADEDVPSLGTTGVSSGVKRAGVQTGEGPGDKHVKFPLEHALFQQGSEFTLAGHFTARVRTTTQGTQKLKRLQLERGQLSQAEKAALEDLIASDGFYRVRVPTSVTATAGTPSAPYVLAAVKARCLAAAQLGEHFELHMDVAGHIVAVSYLPAADCSQPHSNTPPATWQFRSTASVKKGIKATSLTPAAEKLEAPAGTPTGEPLKAGEAEKQPEEKTFWQKYWLYIIPAALVVVNGLASAVPPEPPTAGGGGGGARPGAGGPRRR